uniref:Methylated-DNA--protein-cysteine methyltransferase n=1 Tax=Albugo laibachii Nc14 TaxID=890382 RepID=F0W493_9STRA|nr:hypothetical protein PITG_01216 [Albugo laibachii Nc14]|eukprot:CCA15909.1 hypothetical protein PITG_01216 [Albugo laibachii Nc14]
MTSAARKTSLQRLRTSRTEYVVWNEKKVTTFSVKVYKLISKIPTGKVATYGNIAHFLKSSPRSVGQALKRNPFAPEVPCHRVVASDGKIGGFQGRTDVTSDSISQKRRLLIAEGVVFKEEFQVDPKCMHNFSEDPIVT